MKLEISIPTNCKLLLVSYTSMLTDLLISKKRSKFQSNFTVRVMNIKQVFFTTSFHFMSFNRIAD